MLQFCVLGFVTCLALFGTAYSNELYGTSRAPRQGSVPVSSFSYVGLSGPLNWYGLNRSANGACDTGKHQSPIDLAEQLNPSVKTIAGSSVKLDIPSVKKATFENLGTNVEIPMNGTFTALDKTYKLVQFHYHTPSEHRVSDEYFPMEQHFVLESADGAIAVIGFLIELSPRGFNGPLMREIFSHVSEIATPGSSTVIGPLDFAALKAHLCKHKVYHYSGSLTTPPCSESVAWFISAEPLRIDVATFLAAKKVLKFNSRYTQDNLGTVNLLDNAAHELNV